MAFLQLSSDNPKFSYALSKNPAIPVLVRKHRQGHLFGYYSDEQTFNMVFKDADRDTSFSPQDEAFSYMDSREYDSPSFILGAIDEFLNHLVQESREVAEDVVAEQVLKIGYLHVQRRHYIERFSAYFPWAEFEVEEPDKHGVCLTIRATSTLRQLLNLVQLFALFIVMTNHDSWIYKQESLVEKYLRLILELDAPYYIRSLFKLFLLGTKSRFEKYIGQLAEGKPYTFAFGDTHYARIGAVSDRLSYEGHILDVGCGEGRYLHLSKKLRPGMMYTAVDPDEEVRTRAERKAQVKEYENVQFIESLKDFEPFGPTEVILTEVVEHMELQDAIGLVTKLLSIHEVTRVIITTPNRSFNEHYMIGEGEMRHDDHKWECNEAEFRRWIEFAVLDAITITGSNYEPVFFGIGDVVGDTHTTQGCVIETLPITIEEFEEEEVLA